EVAAGSSARCFEFTRRDTVGPAKVGIFDSFLGSSTVPADLEAVFNLLAALRASPHFWHPRSASDALTRARQLDSTGVGLLRAGLRTGFLLATFLFLLSTVYCLLSTSSLAGY